MNIVKGVNLGLERCSKPFKEDLCLFLIRGALGLALGLGQARNELGGGDAVGLLLVQDPEEALRLLLRQPHELQLLVDGLRADQLAEGHGGQATLQPDAVPRKRDLQRAKTEETYGNLSHASSHAFRASRNMFGPNNFGPGPDVVVDGAQEHLMHLVLQLLMHLLGIAREVGDFVHHDAHQ